MTYDELWKNIDVRNDVDPNGDLQIKSILMVTSVATISRHVLATTETSQDHLIQQVTDDAKRKILAELYSDQRKRFAELIYELGNAASYASSMMGDHQKIMDTVNEAIRLAGQLPDPDSINPIYVKVVVDKDDFSS